MSSTQTPERHLIALVGPTGAGKSELGIYVAGKINGEIISCDASQVYRGFDIGTGKVPSVARNKIPHYLLDIVNPDEHFSAGDYMRLGRKALIDIASGNKIPIVVGGTGLYLRALLEGFFKAPRTSPKMRERLHRIREKKGTLFLHKLLQRIDPAAGLAVKPNDRARIIRALEIYFVSGTPFSDFTRQPRSRLTGFRTLKLGLNPPRPLLYERINRRVESMFEAGFVKEVENLLNKGFKKESKSFSAIGYRNIMAYLSGSSTLRDTIEATKKDSRRYAKRQMTWFKRETDIIWLSGFGGEEEIQQTALCHAKSHLRLE